MKNNPARFSTVYMLASAILFSLGGLFVKVCSWSPLAMNSLRNVFAAFVIFGYFHAHGHKFRCTKTVLLGGAAYAVTNIFFVAATKLTTAANAIVLQFTVPIFIILFSWLFSAKSPKRSTPSPAPSYFSASSSSFWMAFLPGTTLATPWPLSRV